MPRYETVIGLEVHVELATKTKIFCGCSTEFGGEPNTHTCPVCTSMPGSLPVLNEEVVQLALQVALALNCQVTTYCKFDRKNYFYPDNPQNYQISQLYLPIGRHGHLSVEVGEEKKTVGITELHMEEDAGKLIHSPFESISLVDYNRSGVPLVEIVTEPDMRSGEEVIAFLEKLRLMIQYLGASDCKLQEGSMRADVNISIREEGSDTFGTRTEMKNLNSFKAIMHAIEEERERQIGILEAGGKVEQETRRFDDEAGESYSMRSKEDAKDYRYFPDPDLPCVHIDEGWIQEAKAIQPEFYDEKVERYQREYELSAYDSSLLASSIEGAKLFEETVQYGENPKQVANYMIVEGNRYIKDAKVEMKDLKLSPKNFATLLTLLREGKINQGVTKDIFAKLCAEDFDPQEYVKENGLEMVADKGVLDTTIENVIATNEKAVEEYLSGKQKAFGFLMGQTMQAMQGKGNPQDVKVGLQKALDKKRI